MRRPSTTTWASSAALPATARRVHAACFQRKRKLLGPALAEGGLFLVAEAGDVPAGDQRRASARGSGTSAAGPWHTAASTPPPSKCATSRRCKAGSRGRSNIAPLPPITSTAACSPRAQVLGSTCALQRRAGLCVGLQALDVVVGRVVAGRARVRAGRAGHFNVQPVGAQRQPGLGELVESNPGRVLPASRPSLLMISSTLGAACTAAIMKEQSRATSAERQRCMCELAVVTTPAMCPGL